MSNLVIVKIVGEPWLSRAREYREQMSAFVKAYSEFACSIGATSLPNGFPGDRLRGLIFEEAAPPSGWSKRDKRGFASPKKGSSAAEALAQMPLKPSSNFVFGNAILNDFSYDAPDGSWGSGGIGYMTESASIGWIGDVFIARIPHAGRAAAEHLARHPDHTVRHGAAEWTIPGGLEEISQAELDLIDAQHRVARERAAA